jgi:ABC-type multidrug transport system ATPase subunit
MMPCAILGKTTLMDVIAGRKNTGKIEGEIFVDGHPQTFPSFARLNGYCEQTDVHLGTDTVREAIEFSARLRLPADVTTEARAHFVDQILADLELTDIAHRLIGDANIVGLSPGQLKRVTIGVELAANPTFLFLDEPTSGLDSRAALIVCRVIKKIARRGRSVICTIHQPSAELFGMFDRLLLLKSGGKEVYFGPVGESGVELVQYFMEAPIDASKFFRPAFGEKQNPASWMLDVIGAGTSAKGKIADYSEVYKTSGLREDNMSTLTQLCEPQGQAVKFDHVYASSYAQQYLHVQKRLFTVYWRDSDYNNTKFFLMVFLGILFGSVTSLRRFLTLPLH